MSHQITVLVNKQGETALLTSESKAVTYIRNAGVWNNVAEIDFTLNGVTSLNELRARIAGLTAFMAENKIFVAAKIRGIARSILLQENMNIWEMEGRPQEFLDMILQKEKEKEEAEEEGKGKCKGENCLALTVPDENRDTHPIREISPDHYVVSLKEIQENNTQITTKQALLPFLRQKKFRVLEISCSHIPQWLEPELMACSCSLHVSQQSNGLIVLIVKSDIT